MPFSFTLPQPTGIKLDFTGQWACIPHVKGAIPFGYTKYDSDPDMLVPIPDELEQLERAKLYLTEHSYEDVRRWLVETTGRYISPFGFVKRIRAEKKRKRLRDAYRTFENRAKAAAKKARQIEEERLGARCSCGSDHANQYCFDFRH